MKFYLFTILSDEEYTVAPSIWEIAGYLILLIALIMFGYFFADFIMARRRRQRIRDRITLGLLDVIPGSSRETQLQDQLNRINDEAGC